MLPPTHMQPPTIVYMFSYFTWNPEFVNHEILGYFCIWIICSQLYSCNETDAKATKSEITDRVGERGDHGGVD